PESNVNLNVYLKDDFTKKALLNKVIELKPDMLVVSGWMIPEYIWVAKKVKQKSIIPIVAYSDTPWKNTLRQKLNSLVSCFYVKKAFTHLWVSGIRQYDYARKLGFSNDRIILNSLSADVDLFSKTNMELKKQDYPKKFIYIGR